MQQVWQHVSRAARSQGLAPTLQGLCDLESVLFCRVLIATRCNQTKHFVQRRSRGIVRRDRSISDRQRVEILLLDSSRERSQWRRQEKHWSILHAPEHFAASKLTSERTVFRHWKFATRAPSVGSVSLLGTRSRAR